MAPLWDPSWRSRAEKITARLRSQRRAMRPWGPRIRPSWGHGEGSGGRGRVCLCCRDEDVDNSTTKPSDRMCNLPGVRVSLCAIVWEDHLYRCCDSYPSITTHLEAFRSKTLFKLVYNCLPLTIGFISNIYGKTPVFKRFISFKAYLG